MPVLSELSTIAATQSRMERLLRGFVSAADDRICSSLSACFRRSRFVGWRLGGDYFFGGFAGRGLTTFVFVWFVFAGLGDALPLFVGAPVRSLTPSPLASAS